MESDFSGYATKAGLKCGDGRTIMPDAFKHQDKLRVPLVWQHGHTDPENVLGHAILENRVDGVYAHCFFNDSAKAKHTAELVEHKDISMMSIWANDLIERAGRVLHGAIREVSLVLSGANPGALIENVTIRHSDGESTELDSEVIIYTGLELELSHSSMDSDEESSEGSEKNGETEKTQETTKETKETEKESVVEHANTTSDDETVQDVYDTLSDKQKTMVHYMIGEILADSEDPAKDSNVKHNIFESEDKGKAKNTKSDENYTLSHADISGIVADATKMGSLKDAVESFALSHGIENIDILFPEAAAVDNIPEWIKRRTEWVGDFLGSARKSPFSRIKTLSADITVEEARAKGYVKGTMKKEEFFGVSKRVTTPTTVYKKQKLDRDDMIDITDFDVVSWLKGEMRIMLDEEIARAALVGDGRDVAHDDKINEQNIRPISKDHELYTTTIFVNLSDGGSIRDFVDAVIANRFEYKGTGLPNLYTTETWISRILLDRDTLGRRIYRTLEEIATELRVAKIISVETMEEETDIVAIIVNPVDYVFGATRGGEVSMFDDFDIDYNQYKYLIETRLCGALTKLKSAIVVRSVASDSVLVAAPASPTFDPETGELVVNDIPNVIYKDEAGTVRNDAGSPYTVLPGTSTTITATPTAGHYFASSSNDSWTFTANPAVGPES